MSYSKNSIARWMIGVGLLAFGLAPLASPSLVWILVLIYIELGVVVGATFRARFGPERHSGWWFGFATLGWATLVTNIPGLWASAQNAVEVSGVDLANIADQLGFRLGRVMNSEMRTSPSYSFFETCKATVRFWFFVMATFAGGWAGHRLSRGGRAEAPTQETPKI